MPRDKKIHNALKMLLILALLPLLCHCQENPKPQQQLEKVTIQMPWVHQGSEANLYLAKQDGLFEKAGIELALLDGGPGIDTTASVATGAAQFGLMPVDTLFQAREQGQPIVALAIHYQRSPNTFVTLSSSGLTKPRDFVGKSISFSTPALKTEFMAMMGKLGIDDPQMKIVPSDYKYTTLLDGSLDISGAYAIGGVLRLKNRGVDLNVCWPNDYGIRFYGRALVANEEFIRSHPELTRRFVKSFVQSLKNLLVEPGHALDATMKYAREQDRGLQELMIKTSLPLIAPGDAILGSFDPDKLERMNAILLEHGVLTSPDIWQDSFTSSYLPAEMKPQ